MPDDVVRIVYPVPPPAHAARKAAATNGTSRPVIRLEAGKYHEIAEAAEVAIFAADLPMFDRGGILVTPVVAKARGADGQETKALALLQGTEPLAREFMGRTAVFERFDARSMAWVKTKPPRDIAELMLVRRGGWPFAQIHGVLAAPTLRPDGSLLATEGFDPATGLYVSAPAGYAAGSRTADARRSPRCARAARRIAERISLVRSGLPRRRNVGADYAGRARGFSDKPAPRFHRTDRRDRQVLRPRPRIRDRNRLPCAVQAQGADEEEYEKRIVATLIAGYPIMSLDNCTRPLRGAALCQLVERPLVEFRVLGKSMKLRARTARHGVCHGQQPPHRGGSHAPRGRRAARRADGTAVPAGVQAQPVREIIADRGRYVSAALTIVRAYQVAGRPGRLPSFGSFKAWSDCVRSALVWLGCTDPVITTHAAHRNDPDRQQAGALFEAWVKASTASTPRCAPSRSSAPRSRSARSPAGNRRREERGERAAARLLAARPCRLHRGWPPARTLRNPNRPRWRITKSSEV